MPAGSRRLARRERRQTVCMSVNRVAEWRWLDGEAIVRALLKVLFVFALAACGQTASPGSSAEAANAAQAATGGGQAAWVEACVARYVAQSPEARRWAPDQCVQDWQTVVASEPIADAILAFAAGGAAPTAAQLGGNLGVVATGGAVEIGWSEVGEMIPYDVPGALAERGATVTIVGCSQVGVGEFQKYYSVTPAGGTAFPLGIYARNAPTANASSFYTVSVERQAPIKSIAQLRSDGSEWTAACAY